MTTTDWGELMTGDLLSLSAYLDYLEEDGLDVGVAREVPIMVTHLLADKLVLGKCASAAYVVVLRCFHSGSDRVGGYDFAHPHTWGCYCGRQDPSAALVAHGGYYGALSAWHPLFRWVEETSGLRRTTCSGIAEGVEVMFKWAA